MPKTIISRDKKASFLQYILDVLTKYDTAKEKKEIRQYDEMKFVDVNKEIKRSKIVERAK